MKITTEKYNVLGSGSVITYDNEYVRIEINPQLIIQLHFIDDESKGQTIESSPVDNKYLKVSIYNSKGMGALPNPLTIAEDDTTHKKLLLSLAFQKYNNPILCNYTIFEEK